MEELFSYSEALKRLKNMKKVSCVRWGKEGKVFVELEVFGEDLGQSVVVLVLTDTKRNKKVAFTPSVENQFFDNWYEVR